MGSDSLGSKWVRVGPLWKAQFNVANDFGGSDLDGGACLIESPSPGALVGAYASVIDGITVDPRTLLSQQDVYPGGAGLRPAPPVFARRLLGR